MGSWVKYLWVTLIKTMGFDIFEKMHYLFDFKVTRNKESIFLNAIPGCLFIVSKSEKKFVTIICNAS